MLPRPKHHKRTHLKHPGKNASHGKSDQSWLRKFWLALGFLLLLSAGVATYGLYSKEMEADEDVYVSVQVKTIVADDQNAICRLSLLIDPEQEARLQKRQKELEAVVSATLAEIYQGDQRPALSEVRLRLLLAINQKLPRKLQVRDVLIQDLIIGNS